MSANRDEFAANLKSTKAASRAAEELLAGQFRQASRANGSIDVDILRALVLSSYKEATRWLEAAPRVRDPGPLTAERVSDLSFAQVVEEANDVVIVTDANLDPPGPEIVYVNAAFVRLTGYSRAEAIGLSPRMLQGTGTSRSAMDAIGEALRAGLTAHEKVLNFAKCGAPYWLDLRIVPLRNSSGIITHFAAIERDVTLDMRRLDELEVIADRDTLTGIPNRRALLRVADAEIASARSDARSGPSMAFIDVDHFKLVNDTHGHSAGDAILFDIAGRLAENVRRVDMVGRIGGEEFAVVMPNVELDEAADISERLRRAVAKAPFIVLKSSIPIPITVSVGVAKFSSGDSLSGLMQRADAAMYAAKTAGRNRVTTRPIRFSGA